MPQEQPPAARTTPDVAAAGITPDLLRAYRETEYRVYATAPFILRIGETCPALACLQDRLGVSGSAFLTACNPASQALSTARNQARQIQLAELLMARGWCFIPGEGVHPTNGWPPEPSFLVFGIPFENARELGNRFGQNAFLWIGPDATPELILLT